MTTYREVTNEMGLTYIEKTEDDGKIWMVPIDEANSDYQSYLDRDKPKAALSTPNVQVVLHQWYGTHTTRTDSRTTT